MFPSARRPVASICIALLALNVIGCTYIKRAEAGTVIRQGVGEVTMKNTVGVTLKDGRDIRFDDKTRAFVRGDTVQAQVGNQPLAIPVSDVQQVWVRAVDGNRTTLLVIGLTAAALVAFAAFAASQIEYALP